MLYTNIKTVQSLWWSGVEAVRGFAAVQNTLQHNEIKTPDLIIAVGKAAGDMALGARNSFDKPITTIIATKYNHTTDALNALAQCTIYESAHPIPDENSLIAGTAILDAVKSMPANSNLLLLVSGGASSLVEVLQDGINLDMLIQKNSEFMAQGLSIGEINAQRKKMSRIKAGQLLEAFTGQEAQIIAISDVEGDHIDIIGSGIGAYNGNNSNISISISASNQVARQAIAKAAEQYSLPVRANDEILYGDVKEAAERILTKISEDDSGLYIFGGEPTCVLPKNPGRGGRNQHLALLLADKIKGRSDIEILVAGTDGTDGPTNYAGAIVDGQTVQSDITKYLSNANSGPYLLQNNALFLTGPTGTNVMDIVLAIKH